MFVTLCVIGPHFRGSETHTHEDMDEDDAFFMAAAASAMSKLQSMSHTLGNLLRSGPGGRAVDMAGGAPGVWWDEGDDDESTQQTKETREVRPRPDYLASAWGVRLQEMEKLRTTNRLDPDCREAKAFRSDFRVPYEFFLTFVEMVKPVFPSSARDITGRDCVPLELKVRAIYWCIVPTSHTTAVWTRGSMHVMYCCTWSW